MERTAVLIGVALNGERDHPSAPRTSAELAHAARAAVAAGAGVIHLHPFDRHGRETLDAGPCGDAVLTVREACPGVPISLSTAASIEPDPMRRIRQIERWEIQPDLVSANQGEPGIVDLCEVLRSRNIGIEAGLLCHTDAAQFVRSPVVEYAARILIEPLDADPRTACDHAETMQAILAADAVDLAQMHHGYGVATWAVSERALSLGHDVRTGIEDTVELPDGSEAGDNAQLVAAVAVMIARAGLAVAGHERQD